MTTPFQVSFIAAERAINCIYLFHRIADEAAISELFVKYILAVIIFFNGILRGYWLFFNHKYYSNEPQTALPPS